MVRKEMEKRDFMRTSTRHFIGLAMSLAVVLTLELGIPAVVHAETELRANIPFEFYVGDQKFTLGDYTVRVSGAYIRVFDRHGHSAFALTTGVTKSNRKDTEGLLVFSNYENYRFLSQVWTTGYTAGKALLKAPLEVQAAWDKSKMEPTTLRASR